MPTLTSVSRFNQTESSSRYVSSYPPTYTSSTYRSSYRSGSYTPSYRTSVIDSLKEKSTESTYSATSKARDYIKSNNVATRRSSTTLHSSTPFDVSRFSLSNYVPGSTRSSSNSRTPRYASLRDNSSTVSLYSPPSTSLRSKYSSQVEDRKGLLTGSSVSNTGEDRKGLTGLNNIGNTCFLNSIMQCLSNTKVLIEYILNQKYIHEIRSSAKSSLMTKFSELITDLWQGESSAISPYSIKREVDVTIPRFKGYLQQDAQEFLRYFLEGLHDELNRVTTTHKRIAQEIDDNLSDSQKAVETWKRYLRYDNSKIVDTFGGLLKSTLKCTHCGHCSTTFEPFWDLSLPIPDNTALPLTLAQCLDLFTKEEVLGGDEMPVCSKCNVRRKCTKRILIQKFPEVLVIHLKRFSLGGQSYKVESAIDFPVKSLNMGMYAADSQKKDLLYDLYGIVNHRGTCYMGHYTSYCRHPYSGEWHIFNDSLVSLMTTDSISKKDAYVLFYEQTSTSRL